MNLSGNCPICGGLWNIEADCCNSCRIVGQSIRVGGSGMRRISKRFRYLNPKKLKKRRKHGRSNPAPARLVLHRSRLRGSEAALLAARQAETLRTADSLSKTAEGRSELQDDVGRDS